jgi:hypothetical protein
MIVAAPRLLSEEWMLIGRQEDTGLGGRIDLLAVAPDGTIVLIELKRDRTPREVVAQAVDYAYWVSGLDPEDIAAIYGRFAPGRSLADDFRERFGQELDEDALNRSHQIVVVAATLDDSMERITAYLTERGIAINVLLFRVFADGAEWLIGRAWLIDSSEPWDAEFCGSFGHEIPYAVHTGPLHAGPALSGVRDLLEDLAFFSGGVASQSFGLLGQGAARAGLLVCGDTGVEDSLLRAAAVRVRHAHCLLVCAR